MVGAAHALDQAARTLGAPRLMTDRRRPNRCRDRVWTSRPPRAARPRPSQLPPCAAGRIERAVMQGDRQAEFVRAPQLVEIQLGLAARVDEDQRKPRFGDGGIDLRHGIARRVPAQGSGISSRACAVRAPHRLSPRRCRRASWRSPAIAAAASIARSSLGRATVADKPTRRWFGASAERRARSSANRSPRLDAASACNSSKITVSSCARGLPHRRGTGAARAAPASSAGCPARACASD